MFKKIKKWLFGKSESCKNKCVPKYEVYLTKGDNLVIKDNSCLLDIEKSEDGHVDIINDQSCCRQVKINKQQPVSSGADCLVAGTYNIAVNGYDLGSTTGGCDIEFDPANDSFTNVTVSTILQSVTHENLTLFGFRFDCNGAIVYDPKEVKLKSVVIYGPGPGCGVRTMELINPRIEPIKFNYNITKDDLTTLPIKFESFSMVIKDGDFDDSFTSKENKGHYFA